MLYLTDLDYTANVGHNIAEVKIYGRGEKNVLSRPVTITPQLDYNSGFELRIVAYILYNPVPGYNPAQSFSCPEFLNLTCFIGPQ